MTTDDRGLGVHARRGRGPGSDEQGLEAVDERVGQRRLQHELIGHLPHVIELASLVTEEDERRHATFLVQAAMDTPDDVRGHVGIDDGEARPRAIAQQRLEGRFVPMTSNPARARAASMPVASSRAASRTRGRSMGAL